MTQVPADYLSTTSSYNYDQPLPSVARTSTVTQVPPAKKITFFKSGDPQFGGVKMAINQRSFKSFNALMDDLSHRVPLPFGVRTITTPRGIHCISELDQLEDGGCYLCSDKKYVKPINITSAGHRPGPPRTGRPSSTLRRAAQEGRLDDYSTPFTQHGPRIPKKITLVKNGEAGFRRSIILNRRNARSFKTLLDEISEILQFPVKKLFTVDGKKIDSMQALLHCPNVLVCVGREPFKPVSIENLRKHSVEKLPDLAPRSNSNNVNENNENLVHSLVNDDIEKRVHVNKDGSLSVEMKVRFRLLNDETLQWSTQIKKSNLMNRMPCEESGLEEDSGVDPIQKMNPEASSEADDSLYPCDVDSYMSKLEESECDEAHCHSCGKKHQDYDIWKNPMHTSQREEPSNKKKNSLHADDLRSCSRVSNYSKSSCEIKKKSIGDPMSHNSGSFQSNISSTSEAEAIVVITEEKSSKSTTNGYSASSKSSRRQSHREENSKPSSLCSSVSGRNGKVGEGHSKMNSEAHSSRHGSISESVCSKGDHLTETGIRNGNPESVSSRVSSKSEVEDKRLLTQISQESDGRCSQSNISQSSRQIKSRNLHVKMSNSSRASPSETMSICSKHCPAPPKGKPNSKKPRSAILKNSSISSVGTESVFTTGRQQKEVVDSSKPTSFGSKSVATEANDQKNTKFNDSCNGKVEEVLEDAGVQEEWSDLMPSSLPNTSPEEVVQEWLSKIPSETLLMKYEMEDNAEEECIEATTELSCCTNAEEISEDEKAEKKNAEEVENEAVDEVEKETVEVNAVNKEAEEYADREQIPEVLSEAAKADQAECSQSVTSSQNNNKKDLPTSVQTSVQIMKALLSSKHEAKFDRSNSLPEVSPTMGRKLSNSATILITCLASLQLLDEESEDPSDKSKCLNKPRYMELLNIFQALWFGQTAEKSGPSSGQEASGQEKSASGFKVPRSANGDFTPMSSSGVDVSSGSGGSGEEITAGARDCNLLAQKTVEFKSEGQVEDGETATELTEAEEQSKQEEHSSRPSTACSKSKGEEKANSAREESVIQDQCSNCENDQEEVEENENTENSRLVENGEQEEAEAVNDALLKENLEEAADHLSTTIETNVSDADCGTEPKADVEGQLEKGSTKDPEPKVDMATSVGTSLVQQNSVDPDPVWVLRLLKKIEKEFMAHYVNAMNELKVRWNLQNNQQMDEMILELKEEVSKRIQRSIEKELKKIKSRAGAKMPRPPDGPLKRESTLQTEQRRRRLQTMHKKSFFSDKTGTHSRLADTSDLSLDVDEDTAFSAAFEASISEQPSEEEYCPCDTCVRKKMASKPTRNPVVATNAPVMKAFDLQQILRRKKDDNEEACVSEAAQDSKATPSSNVEEAAENTNADEENDESDLQSGQKEMKGNEEKESVLDEMDGSVLNEEAEGPILESQNCETEEEKEEEKGETKEVEEEEEEKVEDITLKAEEEEEAKEEAEGETNENGDEEVEEEAEEETKEGKETKEEEGKEEEETKEEEEEEEEEIKEEEEEEKEEEEERKEEEEERNEEEEIKEEEEGKEEEGKEEEEETKEEEEEEEEEKEEEEERKEEEEEGNEEGEIKEEDEKEEGKEEEGEEEGEGKEEEEEEKAKEEEEEKETKEEEEDMEEEEKEAKEEEVEKEEEEAKEEEEDVKEEEEETKEDEEMQDEERASKEDKEAKEDEEIAREEEEEAEEGEEDGEESTKEEEVANREEEEKEMQNEEEEFEVESKAEDEADNEAEETQEPGGEDIEADEEEKTFKRKEDVGGSEADENSEGDAVEGTEEAELVEDEAAEDGNKGLEDEACSNEEENNIEGGEKYEGSDAEPIGDDPDQANKNHKGNSKSSERASKARGKRNRKRLETLSKAVTFFGSSSLRNFSQQSQKGSDDESEEECQDDSISEHPSGEAQSDESSKPSKMYPDSEEEEDKASSSIDPVGDEEQPDAEGADRKGDERTDKVQISKKKEGSDEIDQDDLDF
ncbi:retinitis pigmentosa 1-like 1 protein [Numida meleagris]|uniref:retinitis pigmentosa 1-like 1 protein n=1 Tax=Numida meleagris TaxID=8996 RepID=UPI000B3D8E9F|nr:retinitis pigmentosa 1-like 1 protein [Numida meleagris]